MSPSRSRGRSRRVLPATVVLLVVLLAGATLVPAASYSTGDVGRGASVGVTDDPRAVLALDTSAAVRIGHTDRLVAATNDLDGDAAVTVTLGDDSATTADLAVDGTTVGDEYTVDLASGDTVAVDVAIPDDDAHVGDEIVFDVSADGVDVDAVISGRSATIEDSTQ